MITSFWLLIFVFKFVFNHWLAQVFCIICGQSYHSALLWSINCKWLQFGLLIRRIMNIWWFEATIYLSKKGRFHKSWLSQRCWNLSKMSFSSPMRYCVRICRTCSPHNANLKICRISQRLIIHRCLSLSETWMSSVLNRIVNESPSIFWILLYRFHKVSLIEPRACRFL